MKKISIYEEKALLNLVAKGDENAFRRLFAEYRSKVYYISRKLLQSDAQVEDALQEIFLKLWLNREKLPELRSFEAYLNTITRNHLYNALRRQASEEMFLWRLTFPNGATSAIAGMSAGGGEDVLSPMALRELKETLQKAMASLTPRQRRVFELSRLEGLKHEEIAVQLSISKETVKKHIGEALRAVRERMKAYREFAAMSLMVLIAGLFENFF